MQTARDLVDSLTYQSYAYNRRRSPEITPDSWRLIFGAAVDRFEERYQQEAASE